MIFKTAVITSCKELTHSDYHMRLLMKISRKLTWQMLLQQVRDSDQISRIQLCFFRCCNFLQTYESFAYGRNRCMKLWSMVIEQQQPNTEPYLQSSCSTSSCTIWSLARESRWSYVSCWRYWSISDPACLRKNTNYFTSRIDGRLPHSAHMKWRTSIWRTQPSIHEHSNGREHPSIGPSIY